MKKGFGIILVAVFTFLVSSSSFAGDMAFGIKGGVNLAKIYGDDVESADTRTAGVGGIFLMYAVSDNFAIQPEVLYSMKGAKESGSEEGVEYSSTMKLNYIEIPVLFKLIFPLEGNVTPCIFAGPAVGINLSAKVSSEVLGVEVEMDVKDQTKSTDFGVVFGGGMAFAAGSGSVVLDARYTLGLTSIDDTEDSGDVKNGAISVMVGYAFPF